MTAAGYREFLKSSAVAVVQGNRQIAHRQIVCKTARMAHNEEAPGSESLSQRSKVKGKIDYKKNIYAR